MNKIKVFVVDDHPIFRQGLRQVIESDPRMVVVGEAADGVEAMAHEEQNIPNHEHNI
jgi:two-component system, NarL family, nitrate/nitrite response regulator NarL